MSLTNKYRSLTAQEIEVLKRQGCFAGDWSKVRVDPQFDTARVKNVQFIGSVFLGRFTANSKLTTGLEKPSGIYNATIADCTIADNARICNIGVHIANYDIGPDVCIENVAKMETLPNASFGNGIEAVVLNEAGGREVVLFNELSAQFAYLMCLHRYRPKLIGKLFEIAASYVEKVRSNRGKVEQGAQIFSTKEIIDVNVNQNAVINSAVSLINGTVLSSAEAPTVIGQNVVAQDFIVAEGSSVTGSVNLRKVYIGQGCRVGDQFFAENSLFFANCEAFLGEACSVFAGPYTVTHHKATLLIACLLSFYNAGSGTNQSNHMYKLGPVHEGKIERGTKAGSFSYVMWPCRVGPFSVILGKHTRTFDTSVFPFTHLEADPEGRCSMVPGLYLTTVGTVRDSTKWLSRERRKDPEKRDTISFEVFSPYTVGKMIKASSILRDLQQSTDRSVEEVTINGAQMKRVLLRTCQRFYQTGIEMYLLEKVLTRFERVLDARVENVRKAFTPEPDAVYSPDWVDIGGLLMARQRLLELTAAIETGRIADIEAFNKAMRQIHHDSEKDTWVWVKNAYKQVYGRDLEKITRDDIIQAAESYGNIKTKFLRLVLVDAEKEFSEVSQTGYGQDGSPDDLSEDFRQVRGQYQQNKFVEEIQHTIESVEQWLAKFKEKVLKTGEPQLTQNGKHQ